MATDQALEPLADFDEPATGPRAPAGHDSGASLPGVEGRGIDPDPRLVVETRRELRHLVREIGELARSDVAPADFYREFLPRAVGGLGGVAGAVWSLAGGAPRLEHQVRLVEQGFPSDPNRLAWHTKLLTRVAAGGQPRSIPPQDGDPLASVTAEEWGNASAFLLLVAPLCVDGQVLALVEVFQRPGAGPTTQRGYLRFLTQLSELACGYLQSRQLQRYGSQQAIWNRWQAFVRAIHGGLDLKRTCHALAHESRELLACDRVAVLAAHGRHCRLAVVSGQATIDPRSSTVRALERLAAAVIAAGEPLWHTDGDDTRDLAPQVEQALQSYLDLAPAKCLGVLPLAARPVDEPTLPAGRRTAKRPAPVGALIVERLTEAGDRTALADNAALAAEHGAVALENSLAHEGLFLLPLWRWLGGATKLLRGRTLPKTLAVAAIVAAAAVALAVVPADFELEARGTLLPVERRDVFAGVDGDITLVKVAHGAQVEAGQPLVELRNSELEMRGAALVGEQLAAQEQLHAVEEALLGERRLTEADRVRLHGERLQLGEKLAGLERQLALHRRQIADLEVRSPIAGQVITWNVEDLLIHRPVRRGDSLLSVAQPDGDWELELRMPEDRMGHVGRAWNERGTELPVEFVLATEPGRTLHGTVKEIEYSAEVRGEEGSTVLVRVTIDRGDLADPRYGAEVTARVHCGRRALGYVWLHDVLAFVQKRILFRL
jgi:hypothetical protein